MYFCRYTSDEKVNSLYPLKHYYVVSLHNKSGWMNLALIGAILSCGSVVNSLWNIYMSKCRNDIEVLLRVIRNQAMLF